MREALNGFLSIALKELLHIRRDPTSLVFALLIPTWVRASLRISATCTDNNTDCRSETERTVIL